MDDVRLQSETRTRLTNELPLVCEVSLEVQTYRFCLSVARVPWLHVVADRIDRSYISGGRFHERASVVWSCPLFFFRNQLLRLPRPRYVNVDRVRRRLMHAQSSSLYIRPQRVVTRAETISGVLFQVRRRQTAELGVSNCVQSAAASAAANHPWKAEHR